MLSPSHRKSGAVHAKGRHHGHLGWARHRRPSILSSRLEKIMQRVRARTNTHHHRKLHAWVITVSARRGEPKVLPDALCLRPASSTPAARKVPKLTSCARSPSFHVYRIITPGKRDLLIPMDQTPTLNKRVEKDHILLSLNHRKYGKKAII